MNVCSSELWIIGARNVSGVRKSRRLIWPSVTALISPYGELTRYVQSLF